MALSICITDFVLNTNQKTNKICNRLNCVCVI